MQGLGVCAEGWDEFIILFFRDDIYFCTSVNFAINGYSMRFRRIHCNLDPGHDFGAFFFCSILAVVGELGLEFKGSLCSASNVPSACLNSVKIVIDNVY